MRRWIPWALLAACAAAPLALAGPLPGPMTLRVRLEAAEQGPGGELIPRKGALRPLDFRGGERACVIVSGDHKPPVKMTVTIYDEKRTRKIAEDAGSEDAPDILAVIWYPPRDGKYVIEISHNGKEYNDVVISLK